MPEAFNFEFPITGGGVFRHTLSTGGILFLLGANGTGKSSLITRLYSGNVDRAKRISAHRQTWFSSNAVDMTPSSRTALETNIRGQDQNEHARHRLYAAEERAAIAIFDLIDADTLLARKIAELVRSKDIEGASKAALIPAPIAVINQLMRSSQIPVEIAIQEQQKVYATKNGGPPYSVAELSDGERNAFLIAADVLTAKPGSLIVIDEPERHLHRSIISPLLSMLFQRRSDCAFVISTHELMLPVDNPGASSILVRSCVYESSTVRSWTVDLLPANAPLDETLKVDILGGRQKMIFIEGKAQSLDAPLYSILFPQISIIPKASCRDVEYAVRGLREAETNHWVKAWGIVDNDRRGEEQLRKLREYGVFALSHFSVEALYYHPEIIRRVVARMVAVTGKDAKVTFEAAITKALTEAKRQRDHFVLDAVDRLTRRAFLDNLPKKTDIQSGASVKIEVDVAALKAAEAADFDRFTDACDLESILKRYPLRESGALTGVAHAIGFKDKGDYEHAVRLMVQEDVGAMTFLRALFGDLPSELGLTSVAAGT